MFDFLDTKTILLIFHVFGAIFGAGGAYASDSIFFSTMKDGSISKDEMRFMKLGSRIVWAGLILLIISGSFLFALDTERYLASSKFMTKVTIVAVILINGIIFHLFHIPRLERNLERPLASSEDFTKRSSLLVASGAVSVVSWTATVVLGMISSIPYSYATLTGIYFVVVIIAASGAVLTKKKLFPF